jgi:hypothetical protein
MGVFLVFYMYGEPEEFEYFLQKFGRESCNYRQNKPQNYHHYSLLNRQFYKFRALILVVLHYRI